MKKGNWKKIMSILAATMGTAFVITSLVAKKEKGKSQYKDESNQMNPLEGKKVVFIENDDEINSIIENKEIEFKNIYKRNETEYILIK